MWPARKTPLACAAATVLLACRSPTQVTVVVTTDVSCKDAPSAVVVVGPLGDIEHGRPASAISRRCDDSGSLGTLVVVPSGATNALVAFKIVEGFAGHAPDDCIESGDYSQCIVARRALNYLPHKSLLVPVAMRVSCKGVPCDATTTCSNGRCVPATISDPSACTEPTGCDVLEPTDGGAPDATVDDAGDGGDGGVDAADGGDGGVGCVGTCPAPIAAGRDFACALSAGQLLCWGDNSSNQLGRGGSGTLMTTPGPTVSPPASPTGIVADTYAACVETATNGFSCWGYQTGLDAAGRDSSTTTLEGTPQRLFAAGTRDVVMTGSNVACWSSASAVSCAGDNTSGQLGVGDANPRATPVTAMLPAGTVLGIATAGRGACALLKDTTSTSVWCWGNNDHGEVDINDLSSPIATPRKKDLSQFPAVVDLASSQEGSSHICAIVADTSVVCWGSNSDGQLGRLPITSSPGAPQRVVRASDGMPLVGATKASLGYGASCAIVGGKVACWGSSSFGQLGRGGAPDGGFAPVASADFVVGLTQVTSLAVGYRHACAMVRGTDVWCWGDNGQGGVGSPNVGSWIATPFHVLP